MKRIIMLLALPLALLTSCEKTFLVEDPKGSLTTDTFYRNAKDLDLASISLYSQFNGAFNQMAGFGTVYGGDDITVARNGNKLSFSDFDTFQPNSSNDRIPAWWNSFYATIKTSNALIDNYQKASATPTEKNNAAGQAYFMRAVSYFFLTRTWGGIPLVTDNSVNYDRPKAAPADVYALIVADLQKAETMLPDGWDGLQRQNGVDIAPTRGSAKALLANVYLTMAGWPLKQADKYALAAAKAKEVIDGRATWGYELLPDFASLWLESGKYNKEAVFGCYFNNTTADFEWTNGNMMGSPALAPGDEGGWDDGFGEIGFYTRFPAGPRKNATYQTEYFVNGKKGDWTTTARRHPYFMKYRHDAGFDPITHVISNWWGSHSVFVIRYAEVLLTYAEATAMASSADASAYAALNQVRRRAGLASLSTGLSQTAFRDAVVAERGWEFAGAEPASRWFDLLRTETVARANALRDAAEEPLKGKPDDAQHTFYWSPIPINDQILNGNLK